MLVVDEDAKLTFPYKRLARRICLGPEAAMERSEKQKNMFEGECNSAPTTDREMIWRRSLSSFPSTHYSLKASKLHSIPICLFNLKDKKFDFFSKTPCIFFERCYYYSCG